MRAELYGSAQLRMSRNSLLERALDQVDEGVEALNDYVEGQIGLIGTNENPFGLYKKLEASKTPAPISAGEITPNDIVIPEGDTGVDPGPFVGELQEIGADARIQDGSIKVLSDSKVLEAGEEVSTTLEGVLNELGIEPKEVGLDLPAVFADGVLFEPDELAIDIEAYRSDIQSAAAAGRNLSINATYPTARTAGQLLAKAAGQGKSLGIYAAIEDPDVMPDLVSKADAQVRSLAALIDDEEALPEELRGVSAPAPEASADEEDAEQETEDAEAAEEAADEDGDDDDDDDGDGAEGLGAMFG
jgi:large subunit ribosomal protein L10